MVYEICAALATLAFILLCFYLIQTLRTVQKSLNNLNDMAGKLDNKIDPIGLEAIKLIKKTNDISETIGEQLESFNPICQTIYNLGNAAEEATASLADSYYSELHEKKKERHGVIEDLIELAAAGMTLWQQIKKRR